ncbi:hypothetical protein WQQ_44660 [Hydrocarboniphaga effusa AP103]|uniref:Uncharacterized protein n=1 Tax=Hydrocarboniphaga effusa AP103 TaxID=1172194 RepID=I8HXD8_9GAMM|nr:hypothetical protein WQQ_44660 [Hydrocarboniphaga effusa AP103]
MVVRGGRKHLAPGRQRLECGSIRRQDRPLATVTVFAAAAPIAFALQAPTFRNTQQSNKERQKR